METSKEKYFCSSCNGLIEHDDEPEDNWDGEYMTPGSCTVCGTDFYVVSDADGKFIRLDVIPF